MNVVYHVLILLLVLSFADFVMNSLTEVGGSDVIDLTDNDVVVQESVDGSGNLHAVYTTNDLVSSIVGISTSTISLGLMLAFIGAALTILLSILSNISRILL